MCSGAERVTQNSNGIAASLERVEGDGGVMDQLLEYVNGSDI